MKHDATILIILKFFFQEVCQLKFFPNSSIVGDSTLHCHDVLTWNLETKK